MVVSVFQRPFFCSIFSVLIPQSCLIACVCLLDFFSISSSRLSSPFNLAQVHTLLMRPGIELIQIKLLSGHGHSHSPD